MCGILCCYKCPASGNKRLLNRGPDHQGRLLIKPNVTLIAYILHVQGSCKQPCSRDKTHVIYNGQIFDCQQTSDTELLMGMLVSQGVLATAKDVKGPCTVVVYNEQDKTLWFWRDYFGRRSLLVTRVEDGYMLCSVGDSQRSWLEVPAAGVFCIRDDELFCYPYSGREEQAAKFGSELFESVTIAKETIPAPIFPLNTNVTPSIPLDWDATCSKFLDLLSESVRIRNQCCDLPLPFSQDSLSDYIARHCYCTAHNDESCCVHEMKSCVPSNARVGVLFSGGIDCTVLACLLDKSVPSGEPIDLLNVSFGDYEKTPDRVSAMASLKDLQKISPERTWNLIKVNISLRELQCARERYITDLLYPHKTVLDDSIGSALWFAARGAGVCEGRVMLSTARLLFSGIGADELMGGYSRHRGAWQNGGGLEGVVRELQLDIGRISERNLGRDNRVIGDHMRDCVAPFLDESFVSFLNPLPIQYKVDFALPRGQGEKMILRRVAHSLGLKSSSVLPKKAIQFGSKIAKLEGRKEKGGDVCTRLASHQSGT